MDKFYILLLGFFAIVIIILTYQTYPPNNLLLESTEEYLDRFCQYNNYSHAIQLEDAVTSKKNIAVTEYNFKCVSDVMEIKEVYCLNIFNFYLRNETKWKHVFNGCVAKTRHIQEYQEGTIHV